ncbi:MFS transporter [Litoreibacter roseus]|uniref:MFS transporter n=1 Tax=Litoreibacter roseus TaxID=2601869 RepID=A0A6N6JJL9_9RHOB|nr:MFS transporter [Litoreibacter roseus]GFE65639.1 MFS transporter [Litoreibacter roseus]
MSDATGAHPLLISVLSASNFVIGMGAFVVIGLLNPIADDFSLTASAAGWIMTTYAIAYAILSPLLVSLTGKIGRRRILTYGLSLFGLASLASAFAPNIEALNVARMFAAAGAGMFTPVAAAVGAGLSPPERRGRALAAVFFGLTLAQVLGVPMGSFVAYTFGWRAALLIVVALALPCIFLIWTRVPSGLSFETVSLADLGATLRDGPTMLAVLFTTSFLGAIYVLYTYISPLLATQMGFERDGITVALLIFGLGAVIGNVLGGMLADKIGPFRTLLGLAGLQVVLMPLFSTLPLPNSLLFGLLLVWSICGWSFMAGQQVRLIAIAPERTGVVLALNAAAIYVGAALGSALGGAVISSYGLGALGVAGGVTALIAVLHIVVSNNLSKPDYTVG